MKTKAYLFLVILLMESVSLHALTVEEAYAAIPHQRTVFDVHESSISAVQSSALKNLFLFSDKATVLRVEGLQAIRKQDTYVLKQIITEYQSLIVSYESETVPNEIKSPKDLFTEAAKLHQKFFEIKLHDQVANGKFDTVFTPEVSQSSQKLIQGYGLLKQNFPKVSAVNLQAFYDYPCALDFQ